MKTGQTMCTRALLPSPVGQSKCSARALLVSLVLSQISRVLVPPLANLSSSRSSSRRISGDKRSLAMDYASHLKRCLTAPLLSRGADGARDVVELLDEYDLLREDFDNIIEVATWPNQKNPMDSVEPKVRNDTRRMFCHLHFLRMFSGLPPLQTFSKFLKKKVIFCIHIPYPTILCRNSRRSLPMPGTCCN